MVPQYFHSLLTSFMTWLDYKLSNDQKAFTNYTGNFYYQTDPSVPSNYTIYASPNKSWIYDSCISGGAIVNSGMYNSSGQFLTRASGLIIDYPNGRILSNNDWGPVSGSCSYRDFNLILSTESEVNFFLEKVFNENVNLTYVPTGSTPGVFYAPCVVFTNAQSENNPWAFGGLDESHNSIRAYIIAKDNYSQEGINSYFNDLAHRYIPNASYGDFPLNSLGDLKTGQWCYSNNILNQYGYSGQLWIEDVANYKMSEKNNKNMGYYISVTDFYVSRVRNTYNV